MSRPGAGNLLKLPRSIALASPETGARGALRLAQRAARPNGFPRESGIFRAGTYAHVRCGKVLKARHKSQVLTSGAAVGISAACAGHNVGSQSKRV